MGLRSQRGISSALLRLMILAVALISFSQSAAALCSGCGGYRTNSFGNENVCVPNDSCLPKYRYYPPQQIAEGLQYQWPSASGACPEGWKRYNSSPIPRCDAHWTDYIDEVTNDNTLRFGLNELVLAVSLFGVMFVLGWLVVRRSWNVNHTRKILGVLMFAGALFAGAAIPFIASPALVIASNLIVIFYFALLLPRFRKRSQFLKTAFASIDRPEDRPHTLSWFLSSYVVSSLVFLTFMWWAVPHQPVIWMLVVTSVALGDIASGAVGYRFGRVRYAVPSLAPNKQYTRSLEGSAALFLTVLTVVFVFHSGLPPTLFWKFAILLPAAITLAEAMSPHTWDEPAMFFAAMLTSMAIMHSEQTFTVLH